jgi:hypothetical protein
MECDGPGYELNFLVLSSQIHNHKEMRHHNNKLLFDCKIQDVIHNNILLPPIKLAAVLFHMRWIYINWFSKSTLCNELISYSTFPLFSIEDTYNRYQQFSGEGRNMNDNRNTNNVKILMWFFQYITCSLQLLSFWSYF